jgi:ribosome-associated protein
MPRLRGHDIEMIRITDHISLDEGELEESFVRSSGPGGRTSTSFRRRAAALRRAPLALAAERRADRLMRLAGSRLTRTACW